MAHALSIIQSSTLTARYRRPFLGLFKLLILVQTLLKPMCNLAPLCILSYCTTFRYEEIVHQTWWGKGGSWWAEFFWLFRSRIPRKLTSDIDSRGGYSVNLDVARAVKLFQQLQISQKNKTSVRLRSRLRLRARCVCAAFHLMFIASIRHLLITTKFRFHLLIPRREATLSNNGLMAVTRTRDSRT